MRHDTGRRAAEVQEVEEEEEEEEVVLLMVEEVEEGGNGGEEKYDKVDKSKQTSGAVIMIADAIIEILGTLDRERS